mmetsp:Transcript_1758/g.3647  ORF Transcript_1758/g.3647 Transcript_1758/m.3647 type:complete len:235 (+) Transcript_1758:360-1064(+)
MVDVSRACHPELDSSLATHQPLHRWRVGSSIAVAHQNCRGLPLLRQLPHVWRRFLDDIHGRPVTGVPSGHPARIGGMCAIDEHSGLICDALHGCPMDASQNARAARALIDQDRVALEHRPLVSAVQDVAVVVHLGGPCWCPSVRHLVHMQRLNEFGSSVSAGYLFDGSNVRTYACHEIRNLQEVCVLPEDVESHEPYFDIRCCGIRWSDLQRPNPPHAPVRPTIITIPISQLLL